MEGLAFDLPFSWATDVHFDSSGDVGIEAVARQARIVGKPLLLTGDISNAKNVIEDLEHLRHLAPDILLYVVLGNHDYYGSSVAQVAGALASLCPDKTGIIYLQSHKAPIEVDKDEYLIGVDGYADGRAGYLASSTVELNDYLLCSTFAAARQDRSKLGGILASLGRASAVRFTNKMTNVPSTAKVVWVATHAPPFEEAHFAPDGSPGDDDWAPHFVNVSLGRALLDARRSYPATQFNVVCGHTHTGAITRVGGINVLVGWAKYGDSYLQDPRRLPWRGPSLEAKVKLEALYQKMQTEAAGKAMQAAFEALPEELGEAAVAATKKIKDPTDPT